MSDIMVRAVSTCGHFRAVAAITTGVVEVLRRRQGTAPVGTAALGRALTGAFLLASPLKGSERVMIQILGDGPIEEICVEADPRGNGRGYVRKPQVDLPLEGGKLPVGKAVGKSGTLTVIKDLGLKEPYRGVVPITSGEIGKDLAYYLTVSEQVPSAVALGVYLERDLSVTAAGGYLVQTLPGASDAEIDLVENNIRKLPLPTELIRTGASPSEMLRQALFGFELKFLEDHPLRFYCRCSHERVSKVLVAMGAQELKEMIEGDQTVEITCEFCRQPYRFSGEVLRELLSEATRKTTHPKG